MEILKSWVLVIVVLSAVVVGLVYHVRNTKALMDRESECIERGGVLVCGALDYVCVESR